MLRTVSLLATTALVLACVSSVYADVTIRQSVVVDSPVIAQMLKGVSPEAHAAMQKMGMGGGPTPMTIYCRGKQVRIEIGTMTVEIVDPTSQTLFTIYPSYRTYWVFPLSYKLPPDGPTSVTKQPGTKTILGHICRRYRVTASASWGVGTGDIWIAPDINIPPVPDTGVDITGQVQNALADTKGYPLKSVITVNGPSKRMGTTTTTITTFSITYNKLTASLFKVPAVYKRIEKPSFGGMPAPSPAG